MIDQRSVVPRFYVLRSCMALVIAATMASCHETPTAPTSRFPVMSGNWSGTLTVETAVTPGSGPPTTSVCSETWAIASQTEGQFAGTYQTSGGCAESGSVNGSVSMSGELTGLTFTTSGGSRTTTCQRVSGDGVYTGRLNGTSLMAQTFERTACVAGGAGLQLDASFRLLMNKQ